MKMKLAVFFLSVAPIFAQSPGPTMKVIVAHQLGGPEALRLEDVTLPQKSNDRLRLGAKTMTPDEYEKLPVADREHFFQCPDCGEVFDFRIEDEAVFHLAHHKPEQPASRKTIRYSSDDSA